MFGHNATATLEGFLIFKLMTFHWIYYGPFIFIATYSIIMRDKSDGYDEITWSIPRKRSRIIIQRTIAMLIYLWIIIALNWIAFWIGELALSTFADVVAPNFISTIIAFTFLGLGYSLFLIVFITLALIPNPKYIIITLVGAFMIAIFLPVISFINQDFSWISYLSPFQYFDVIGLLLNDVKIVEEAIPTIVAGGVIAIILYLSSVMLLTPRKDIV
jgi:ABC-type transport system involved in multi-copper enzyme maturation permease subunit